MIGEVSLVSFELSPKHIMIQEMINSENSKRFVVSIFDLQCTFSLSWELMVSVSNNIKHKIHSDMMILI